MKKLVLSLAVALLLFVPLSALASEEITYNLGNGVIVQVHISHGAAVARVCEAPTDQTVRVCTGWIEISPFELPHLLRLLAPYEI